MLIADVSRARVCPVCDHLHMLYDQHHLPRSGLHHLLLVQVRERSLLLKLYYHYELTRIAFVGPYIATLVWKDIFGGPVLQTRFEK